MSFSEFVFSARFIQKTIKEDLDDRLNHAYPQRKQPQKVTEDSRGLHTKAEGEALAPPAGRPAPGAHMLALHCYVGSPPPPRLHLRRLFKSV